MATDREGTLRLADRLLGEGKVEAAVAEYVRAADAFLSAGFVTKAAAVYKKTLRVQPLHEHTLHQLADIAARQGLTGEARGYYRQLADVRRGRGDGRGAAECVLRLALLDGADADTRLAAAQAAVELGEPTRAVALLTQAGLAFEKQNRPLDALSAVAQAAQLDPGDDPELLLTLARLEIQAGRDPRPTLMRVLTVAPWHGPAIGALVDQLAASGRSELAYGCVEMLADVALLQGDHGAAAAIFERFLGHGPHAAAAERLAELRGVAEGRPETTPADIADILAPEAEAEADEPVIPIEIDLSDAIANLDQAAEEPSAASAPNLEEVFAHIRARATNHEPASGGDQFRRGLEHLLDGRVEEAIADLEGAARSATLRFAAAAQLGRLFIEQGRLTEGVEWLERAAEAPAPTADDAHALLYDLATALEQIEEPARALAVLMELEVDVPGYRDVAVRVEALRRQTTGSSGA